MTLNQQIAKDYLLQYTQVLYELDYLEARLEEQRTKAASIRSSLDIPRGLVGNKEVPLEGRGTSNPKAKEKVLDVLIEQSKEYDRKFRDAQKLANEIELSINQKTTGIHSLVLRYRYIQRCKYEEMAVIFHYSYQHIKRLHWRALEEFGEKMSHNEP